MSCAPAGLFLPNLYDLSQLLPRLCHPLQGKCHTNPGGTHRYDSLPRVTEVIPTACIDTVPNAWAYHGQLAFGPILGGRSIGHERPGRADGEGFCWSQRRSLMSRVRIGQTG